MVEISAAQEGMMRNALGLLWADKPYRNRFALFMGSDNFLAWADLCRKGLAEHFYTEPSGMMFFCVTLDGHARIGVEPEQD